MLREFYTENYRNLMLKKKLILEKNNFFWGYVLLARLTFVRQSQILHVLFIKLISFQKNRFIFIISLSFVRI